MYIGYILNREQQKIRDLLNSSFHGIITLGAFSMWLWMIRNFKAFWLVHCEVGNGMADIVGSLCGCYMLLLLSGFIDRHISLLANIFASAGKYSLLFLSIHILELRLINYTRLYQLMTFLPQNSSSYFLAFRIITKLIIISIGLLIACRINPVRKIFGYKTKK